MADGKKSPLRYILPTLGGLGVTFAAVAKYSAFTAAGVPPLDAAFDVAALGAQTCLSSIETICGAGFDLIAGAS